MTLASGPQPFDALGLHNFATDTESLHLHSLTLVQDSLTQLIGLGRISKTTVGLDALLDAIDEVPVFLPETYAGLRTAIGRQLVIVNDLGIVKVIVRKDGGYH